MYFSNLINVKLCLHESSPQCHILHIGWLDLVTFSHNYHLYILTFMYLSNHGDKILHNILLKLHCGSGFFSLHYWKCQK